MVYSQAGPQCCTVLTSDSWTVRSPARTLGDSTWMVARMRAARGGHEETEVRWPIIGHLSGDR
jgi:hypothetical protein